MKGFWKRLGEGYIQSLHEFREHQVKLRHESKYYDLSQALIFIGFMAGVTIIAFFTYNTINLFLKPYPVEIEGSCNTGFIGVDYKSVMDNQPYSTLDKVYDGSNPQDFRLIEHKKYFKEYLPKELNLKNIDGLNCNFKAKIPLTYDAIRSFHNA